MSMCVGGGPGAAARARLAGHRRTSASSAPSSESPYPPSSSTTPMFSRFAHFARVARPTMRVGVSAGGGRGRERAPVWVCGCVAFSPSDTLRRACLRRLPPPPLRLAGPCWLARPRSRPLRPCTTRFLSWQLRLTRWRRRPVASVASAPRTSSAHTLRC